MSLNAAQPSESGEAAPPVVPAQPVEADQSGGGEQGTALMVVSKRKEPGEFSTTEKQERDFSIEIHKIFKAVSTICANAILTRHERGKPLTLNDGIQWSDPFLYRFNSLMNFRKEQGPTIKSQAVEDVLYTPIVHIMQKTYRVMMEHDLAFLVVAFTEKVVLDKQFNKRKDFMDVTAKAWEAAVNSLPSEDQVAAAKRVLAIDVKRLETAGAVMREAAARVDYNNQPCMTSQEFCRADFNRQILEEMDALRGQIRLPMDMPFAHKPK